MTIITLTSDYGHRDHYAAVLKGRMLSSGAPINLVDITHSIRRYDLIQGAYVLAKAYHAFPAGTIHLLLVHNREKTQPLLICKKHDHFFLSADNGALYLLHDQIDDCWKVDNGDTHWQSLVVNTATKLAKGIPPEELGQRVTDFERKIHLQPVVTNEYIRGIVIHIDHYENVIFNVNRELFEKVRKERRFEIYYKRHDPIVNLHQHYYDVPVGEVVCLFNHSNHLELAINMGTAASLLGLNIDDAVQILFNT